MALQMSEPNSERNSRLGIERAPKESPTPSIAGNNLFRGMAPPKPSAAPSFGRAKKNKDGLWEIESGSATYADGMAALSYEDALSSNEDLQFSNPLTPTQELPIPDDQLYGVANDLVNQHLAAKLTVQSQGGFDHNAPDTQNEFSSAIESATPAGPRFGADVKLEGPLPANEEAIHRGAVLQQTVTDEAMSMARELLQREREENQSAIDSFLGSAPKVVDMAGYRQERESLGMGSMLDSVANGVQGGKAPEKRSFRKTSLSAPR